MAGRAVDLGDRCEIGDHIAQPTGIHPPRQGTAVITGPAWSGHGRIARVDISPMQAIPGKRPAFRASKPSADPLSLRLQLGRFRCSSCRVPLMKLATSSRQGCAARDPRPQQRLSQQRNSDLVVEPTARSRMSKSLSPFLAAALLASLSVPATASWAWCAACQKRLPPGIWWSFDGTGLPEGRATSPRAKEPS